MRQLNVHAWNRRNVRAVRGPAKTALARTLRPDHYRPKFTEIPSSRVPTPTSTLNFACKIGEYCIFAFNPDIAHCIANAWGLEGENAVSVAAGVYMSDFVADRIVGGTTRIDD